MSQATLTTPGSPLTMAALKAFLDAGLDALLTVHRGDPADITNPTEGMLCWDNTVEPDVLKRYTETAGWISILSINVTTGAITSSVFAASGANSDITSMTGLDDGGIPVAKVDDAMKDDGSNLAIGSDADGDTYYRASGVLARLAKGTANFKMFMNAAGTAPEWAAGVKAGTFTRDLTAASGDVSYSGVGFKPSAIIFFANKLGNPEASWGFSTGAVNYTTYYRGTGIIDNNNTQCIKLTPDAHNNQYATVKTLDADGFTLTWTKIYVPTGTGTIFYLAFR